MDFRDGLISILSGALYFTNSTDDRILGSIIITLVVFWVLNIIDSEWDWYMHGRSH